MVLGEAWPGAGLESWFVAYVAAREDLWEAMRKQKQVMSICTSTPTQFAAVRAAEVYPSVHRELSSKLGRFREKALEVAGGPLVEPVRGAAVNLLALRVQDPEQARDVLGAEGFAFADGIDFGAPGVVRLSVTPENMIAQAVRSLSRPILQGDTR